ncbi:MAG: hypothetical protein LZF61_04440 [Nitrosomonas sp.]|nr:MAG: hypothetical protein LZF61_04440 [Nitrosomonas sp.]
MLRIRDRMDPTAILGTNNLFDMSHRFTGGLILEKEIGRQRFTANGNWTHTRFEKFDQMNNNLKSVNGNWNWVLGNRLEGNMGVSYTQSLAPFLFQPGVKTIRTEQTAFFNGAWQFHPNWSLNGGYIRYDLETDSPLNRMRFLNRTEDRFEGGIDYQTSRKNIFGVIFRNTIGNFPTIVTAPDGSLIDNSYDQKEVLAKIIWRPSGKSEFQWRGGWVERTNVSFNQRDFSGFNARMSYNWQPTDKLGLTINGWRETSAIQTLTASFSLSTGVSVVPSWNLTPKIRLEGDFSYETRNFNRFASLTDPLLSIGGENTFRNAVVKLTYVPHTGLELTASGFHNDLKSESSLGGFNANGGIMSLRYTYGQK